MLIRNKHYTTAELDAVIDRLDLGFMRNRLKNSPEEMATIVNSLQGQAALFSFRINKFINAATNTTKARSK